MLSKGSENMKSVKKYPGTGSILGSTVYPLKLYNALEVYLNGFNEIRYSFYYKHHHWSDKAFWAAANHSFLFLLCTDKILADWIREVHLKDEGNIQLVN